MKRTNLLLLSLCALGLIFTRCDFNWNFSRKYTIAIKQPDQAYIQSAELDSIWKSSYEYAVLIPEDTTISTYFHLIEALNWFSSVYLSVSRLASRVWFHPVVWNPLCFAEIVYG